MAPVEELSSDGTRAYDRIVAQDGLLQSELWKTLDMSNRNGSYLATSLAD